jgi:hypothetical protein
LTPEIRNVDATGGGRSVLFGDLCIFQDPDHAGDYL